MKKDGKPNTLAVIDNNNFYDTHTLTHKRTWQLYDLPGPEGRVSENSICTYCLIHIGVSFFLPFLP